MEAGMETRDNRLFMVIALVLTGSLFLGLVGIGGLVVYRLFAAPTEVAMPPEAPLALPTVAPTATAAPTSSPLPSATDTPAPTATLVVPPSEGAPASPGTASTSGQDSPGLNSPGSDTSEMPQTGLGLTETMGLGLALASLLGGARIARHLRS